LNIGIPALPVCCHVEAPRSHRLTEVALSTIVNHELLTDPRNWAELYLTMWSTTIADSMLIGPR
jgi:hypothetical protein